MNSASACHKSATDQAPRNQDLSILEFEVFIAQPARGPGAGGQRM
jgi:hypothetical protein